ncbi:transmembrane protein 14C [Hydra vulgaris]|nr:transmembrane protein 14C [Hydra vulgaris]
MASTDYMTYGFALTVIFGGVIGFLKAGSFPSLIAGVLFGGLIAFGATQTSQNPKNILVVLVVSIILMIVMGTRFYKSGKFMPAGLVFVLSILNICRHLYNYKWK